LALLSLASAARHDVQQQRESEQAQVVPRPISRALQKAQRNAEAKLVAFEQAESAANAAKAEQEETASRKMSKMEEMKAKTTASQTQVATSRQAMADAEKAASQHMAHSGEFEAALAEWNALSKAVEGMEMNVTMKEEAMAATLAQMKKHLEALKDALDGKKRDRDAAEQNMMEKTNVVLSANKLKADAAADAATAEQAAQQLQKELRQSQAEFDKAVSNATKAEAKSKEAANVAREAKNKHEDGQRTVELIKKLRKAVDVFYSSVDDFVESEHSGGIESDPKLTTAFEMYNLMATTFLEVQKFSPDLFEEVKSAVDEIERNSVAAIAERCDPTGRLMDDNDEPKPEFEAECGSGLWGKVNMTRLEIPV